MDVFTDIVDTLRVHGVVYFHTHFTPPWGVRVPAYQKVARFHLVTGGHCWVTVDGLDEPVRIGEGDLILIPHGTGHLMSDLPGREPLLVDDIVRATGFDGRGALVYRVGDQPNGAKNALTMICGHLELDHQLQHPMLADLPPYVLVRAEQSLNHTWLADAVRFITLEVEKAYSGADAVVTRLSEILFIQVARAYLAEAGDGMRFMGALRDPSLSRALAALHQNPGRRWTVEGLADEAGLSRARFAARFQELVGQPPIEYLSRWRMLKAAQLLRTTRRPLKAIAFELGYRSEESFSKTFGAHLGLAPHAYRGRYSA